jgi:hypothetical protein
MKALISIPAPGRASALEKSLFALAKGATGPKDAVFDSARQVYPTDKTVSAIIAKADQTIGTAGTAGWAAELVHANPLGEFLATLAPMSAAAWLVERGLQVTLPPASTFGLPAREGGPSTTVSWVGEGDPIPVRSYAVNEDCELAPKKFGFIIGISRELVKRANGEAIVRQLIREDAAATLDAAYFSTATADSDTHAGLLSGVTAIEGYAGGDRTAIETDLEALTDVVAPSGSGEFAFIVSPKRAARMRVRHPDLASELTFLPSLAIADDRIVCVDPASWAHGLGDFEIETGSYVSLHQSDTPAEIVSGTGPATADPVRSYYQTNAISVRLLADVAFAARRANAVAWVDNATW